MPKLSSKPKGSKCKKEEVVESPASSEVEDGSSSNGSDDDSNSKDQKGLIHDSDADAGKCRVLVLLSNFTCNLTHIFVSFKKVEEEKGKHIRQNYTKTFLFLPALLSNYSVFC